MPFKDPQKAKEYRKNHYIKNREDILKNQKQYNIDNKEKITEYQIEYRKTLKSTKIIQINNWKKRGLIGDYEMIRRIYLSTKYCDDCGHELNTGDNRMKKCMDHDHIDGQFRGIVCIRCNNRRGK